MVPGAFELSALDAATSEPILPDPSFVEFSPTDGWEPEGIRIVGQPIGKKVKFEFRVTTDPWDVREGLSLDDILVRQN